MSETLDLENEEQEHLAFQQSLDIEKAADSSAAEEREKRQDKGRKAVAIAGLAIAATGVVSSAVGTANAIAHESGARDHIAAASEIVKNNLESQNAYAESARAAGITNGEDIMAQMDAFYGDTAHGETLRDVSGALTGAKSEVMIDPSDISNIQSIVTSGGRHPERHLDSDASAVLYSAQKDVESRDLAGGVAVGGALAAAAGGALVAGSKRSKS